MNNKFKEGDVFRCTLGWEWIFIKRDSNWFIYPMDRYNKGKLSESDKEGDCSFLHPLVNWDLSNIKIIRNERIM